MKVAAMGGVVLGVLVTIVSAVILGAGLHENFALGNLIALVLYIGINVGVIIWTLNRTAGEKKYLGQLTQAALVGLIGGAVVLLGSWLLLSMVFPEALAETADAALGFFESQGLSDDQIDQQMASIEAATPVSQAFAGFIGTLITSIVVGAVTAIFRRQK